MALHQAFPVKMIKSGLVYLVINNHFVGSPCIISQHPFKLLQIFKIICIYHLAQSTFVLLEYFFVLGNHFFLIFCKFFFPHRQKKRTLFSGYELLVVQHFVYVQIFFCYFSDCFEQCFFFLSYFFF